MSSGTTDASLAISSIHGVGTSKITLSSDTPSMHIDQPVPSLLDNITDQVVKDYSEGFKSSTEYYTFLQVVESSSDFPLKYTQAFINTTDSHVLDVIGKSRFVAKKVKEAIHELINPWQSDAIKQILKVLKHVPFDLQNLIDNELGFALKSIKRTSLAKNDAEVQCESISLMTAWKELQNNLTNTNGKRDSPERAMTSSTSQNEPKKIKLAIQKDPPSKPKAIIDSNFLSALGEPKTKSLTDSKKFKIVRPSYNTDTSTTNNEASANSSTSFTLPMRHIPPLSPARNEFNRTADPDRRRVTFKADLCQIKIYQPDPQEWTSFDNATPEDIENYYPDPRQIQHSQQQQQQQQQSFVHYNVPRVDWYQPLELSFNTDENPNLVIPKLIRTPESFQQDDREKKSLAAIYTSIQHIPMSPGEPEEIAPLNNDTRIIPLEDINVSHNSTPTPPPSSTGSINPNELFSAATLNAIAAAIKDPSLLQQQPAQQQLQQQPMYQQHVPMVVYPQQQLQQPQMNTNYSYQAPQPAPQPQASQPDLSNVTVEAVLKNNPGIMQSLKQLSFLTSGNTGNNVNSTMNNAMVPAPTQPNYQQQTNYTSDDSYNENTFNENTHKHRRKRGRARGGAGRKRTRTCAFFNTPEGCRKGDSCPWPHE